MGVKEELKRISRAISAGVCAVNVIKPFAGFVTKPGIIDENLMYKSLIEAITFLVSSVDSPDAVNAMAASRQES